MPTYRTTARNLFRTPSGAVGEAPDGPGGMAALSDDVDAFLGVGGAEYCANNTAMQAIPSTRLFKGKLAYRADTDTVYRYVGIGGTALGGLDTTSKWQAWHKPATAYTANFSSGFTAGNTLTSAGWWGITAGRFWLDLNVTITQASWIANAEMNITLPASVAGQVSVGQGLLLPGGAVANSFPLVLYTTAGTPGASTSGCRIRVPRITGSTVPGTPTLQTPFTAVGAGTANDQMLLSISAPSATVA